MSLRDPNIIDGFNSVQAMKRASSRAPARPRVHDSADKAPPAEAPPPAAADAPPAPPTRAGGHVVVPAKRLVICYACGYSHTISGKMHHSYCPKCRTNLNTEDVLVSGPRSEDVLTIGNVTIGPDASFASGVKVTGQNILLDGDATPLASITATEAMEIGTHAKFDAAIVNNVSGVVRIPAGNDIALDSRLSCSELEIFGTLRASVSVMKSARIHPGGALIGAFHGPTLLMEDGGGLVGEVDLSPAHRQEPVKNSRAGVAAKTAAAVAHAVVIGLGMVASLVLCVVARR
ncbi:MAG: hypothetical protein GX615_11705 [Lentisphaerae bacterium]|nr:hypothetical protein [Lentisphaerota bacterium]